MGKGVLGLSGSHQPLNLSSKFLIADDLIYLPHEMNPLKISLILVIVLITFSCGNKTAKQEKEIVVQTSTDSDTFNSIAGVFDIPELRVKPSPDVKTGFTFPKEEKI